ncbi:MAG: DMT family transporter [Desulfomonilaceae bacterium]
MVTHINQTSQHIPVTESLLLVLFCLIVGANIVSIKFSNLSIPPILAATIRSVVASCLLWLWARAQNIQVGLPAGLIKHGVALGLLFGAQFLLLYWGLSFTDASRGIILVFCQPLATALLAHFTLPGDRLYLAKAVGLCMSFVGLVIVFDSRSATLGELHWIGDAMMLTTGLLWAANNIYIKKFVENTSITHFQTLFAHHFFSIPLLMCGAAAFEWGREVSPQPAALGALAYQCVVVAFIGYLVWFRLLHRYQASRLVSFIFLTPVFGVILSGLLLGESLPLSLWTGLGLVTAGIYLVNRPTTAE